jgi:hypothetical protein
LSSEEAIQAFIQACNRHNTLFLTDQWLDEKLPHIRQHLSRFITENEALALRELAVMKAKSGEVIGWLKSGTPSWTEYCVQERRKDDRRRLLQFSRSMLPFPWADVYACADDSSFQERAVSEQPKTSDAAHISPFTSYGTLLYTSFQGRAVSEQNEPKTSVADQLSHCTSCGEILLWIYFKSPDWTWEKLCGRAGWLAICRTCRIQADFQLTMMN